MTTWTSDELSTIDTAEELEIAPLRRDGTLRKPVIIWVVRVGNDLYVRSMNGRTAAWFRGVQERHEGDIRAGGVDKDVTFVEETSAEINDQVDREYGVKYGRYSSEIISRMRSTGPRSSTIKLIPR